MANSGNWSLRLDGVSDPNLIFFGRSVVVADFNNDGKPALVVGNAGSAGNGHITIITNLPDFLGKHEGTGNLVDMATPSNYTVVINGLGGFHSLYAGEFTNDGGLDLAISSWNSPINGSLSGSFYIISRKIFMLYDGTTGNTINITDPRNYTWRYDGAAASSRLSQSPFVNLPLDLNGDGSADLLIGGAGGSQHSLYIIYNFPHTISLSGNAPGNISTFQDKFNVAGTVNAPNSVTKIANVQYNLDSNDPSSSNWKDCKPSDGEFNSLSEGFSCNDISLSGLESNTKHTLYIRAQDTNGSYTAPSSYNTNSFWYGSQPDTSNCPQYFKYCLGNGLTSANGATVLTTTNTDPSDLHVQITTDPLDTTIFRINVSSAFNGYPISPTTNPYTIILPYTVADPHIVYLSNNTWLPILNPMVVNNQDKTVATTTTITNTEFKVVEGITTTVSVPVATVSAAETVIQNSPAPKPVSSPQPQVPKKTCFLFICW
ncbi:MAG: FG-GAP repeat protein [Patescibacteria group bacterium]|nr:FG-GAP repeat protein [Patescibacteria group bacterium]MCL5432341.1 FG-GAP repeat protein [Patescibacteria group bacterium]